jgi:hypothetical protein
MNARLAHRLVVALGLLAAAALLTGCNKNKSSGTPPDGGQPGNTNTPQGGTPPEEVSWSGTAAEADKGGYNFRKSHEGKLVVVSGKLVNVSSPLEQSRTRFLEFEGEGKKTVTFHVPVKEAPAGKFTAGQTVKLKGVLTSDNTGGMTLKNCEALEAGPSAALRVTADEIMKAAASGDKAALDKYQAAKQIIVTGTVSEVAQGTGGPRYDAIFQTADGWPLRCSLAGEYAKQNVPVKAGQQVKLIGMGFNRDTGRKQARLSFCEVITE